MRKLLLGSIILIAACLPFQQAAAHASPTLYTPAANAVLGEAPNRVQIQFTERIEANASSITVLDKDGQRVDDRKNAVSASDPRLFSVGLGSVKTGTYTVSWQVVSADDGHFTKGAYVFSVGKTESNTAAPQFEVIYRSTTKEGLATSLELIGLALILGYAFVPARFSVPSWIRFAGLAFVFVGAAVYFGIKSFDLAAAQSINVSEALAKFASTIAGQMAIARMTAAAALSLPFVWKRKTISALIIAGLFWARIRSSHAAAAEFMPAFTMLDHLTHLFSKSLWVGLLLVMAFSGIKMDEKISKLLSWAIALAAITGGYIVWLDLKDVNNIFLTAWGSRFVTLSAVGGLLLALRLWNHFISGNRFLRLEAAVSAMLMFATGFIMITTPPTIDKNVFEKTAESQGNVITLREHPFEKDQMLLIASGGSGQVKNMVVTLREEEKGIGPVVAVLSKRSDHSFVFPKADMSVPGRWKIEVTAQKAEGYDATASFVLDYPHELEHNQLDGAHRVFDRLALMCLVFALAGAAAALAMFFTKGAEEAGEILRLPWVLLAVAAVGIYIFVSLAGPLVLKSDFRKACEENYDMWHVMTPMRSGRAVSQKAVPGCMLADGSFHFADFAEYKYFMMPIDTRAELTPPEEMIPGTDAHLQFEIKDSAGGFVSDLVITHEKLLHAIIITEDFKEFAHVHPQQISPGRFSITHRFPKAGKYLIALDYQVKNIARSERFTVNVAGAKPGLAAADYQKRKIVFDGYDVALNMPATVQAGEAVPFKYRIEKAGQPVIDLEPYLGASMHIAVVKSDFSQFIHTHGELTSSLSAAHFHAAIPTRFGPEIFSGVNFPTPGTYYMFAEFKHQGKVVLTRFAVQAE